MAITDIDWGTVTLTNGSTTVTGSGTSWIADDIRDGDTFVFVDGGDGFQQPIVASVQSNTALTLRNAWEGPTLTATTYTLRYQWDSSRVSAMSRRLIMILDNGNIEAFAALTGPGVAVFNGPHSMEVRPFSDFVNGVRFDVQVDTLADRDAYDGQTQGFSVLVSDVGDGRSAVFTKNSNTSGDWSDAAYITGPVGPTPDVEATVDMLPPGSTATVTPTPITGGVRLDFELPEASGFYNAGVYDIGEAYDQDDVVRHNGSAFIALQAVPVGESPSNAMPPVDTAYWQVLAVKGQDGTGTGDVVGPSGAVTDRIAVFDGTTGKQIKDGGVTIDELQPEGAVRYDEGQSLSAGEKLQARENISAASAMDFRPNISVNGSLIDSQENGDTLGTTNGYFYADQRALYKGSLGVSAQRVAYTSLAGGRYAAEIKCTTAKTTLGATDLVLDSEPIEGSRPEFVAAGWGAAGAKQFVHRKEFQKPAGTYSIHVTNSAGDRHCWVPYTITAGEANTKVVKEIVIPGDTSGTWLRGGGQIGMVIDDVLASGSTYVGGTAGVWGATAYYAGSGQKNFLDSTSNVARHTDFGTRLDVDATGVYGRYVVGEVDAVYRSERYSWLKSGPYNYGIGQVTLNNQVVWSVDTLDLCKTPTSVTLSNVNATISNGSTVSVSNASMINAGPKGVSIVMNMNASTFTPGNAALVLGNSAGRVFISARLS